MFKLENMLSSPLRIVIAIIIAVLIYTCIMTFSWVFIREPANKIHHTWESSYYKTASNEDAVSNLLKGFGYGGFIHHFKNYVLRRSPEYLELAEISIISSLAIIETYQKAQLTLQQRKDLEIIKGVLNEYRIKTILVRQNLKKFEGLSPKQLDELVRVDDSLAFVSLQRFYESITSSLDQAEEKTSLYIESFFEYWSYWVVFFTSIYWILFYLYVKFQRQLVTNVKLIKSIYDMAPDAIVLCDEAGRIISANYAFFKIFGLATSQNLAQFRVEDFVYSGDVKGHESKRKAFMEREQTAEMGGRNSILYAKSLTGDKIPVDVSISSVRLDGKPHAIAIIHDRNKETKLMAQANTDALTGVHNRSSGEEQLVKARYRIVRYGMPASIMFVDVDNFKKVNDQLGHDAGDDLLVNLTNILQQSIRNTDTLIRWGGDEFLIIIDNADADTSLVLAEGIRQSVEQAFMDDPVPVTASIGIAQLSIDFSLDQLIKKVDLAMYKAKSKNRNCCVVSE
ncbi:MAG: GGDEF domain-containing protein [Bermanella sp.]